MPYSSTLPMIPPLWTTNPTDPGEGVTLNGPYGMLYLGLYTPKQLGPMMRKPPSLAIPTISFSTSAHSGSPDSENPAV